MAARLRTFLVGLILVAYLLVAGPLGLLAFRLSGSPAVLYRLAVPAARFGLWACGVRFRVSGTGRLEASRNYLFMPNHISNVDPPVVVSALRRDARMMAKASLFRIPIFGRVMSAAGFVAVERDDRQASIHAVEQAAQRLRAGLDFVIFPEGTRSRDGKLLPLKKGPFFLAQMGGAPVVPVRIGGTRDVMPKGGRVIYPGAVTVEVCAPIEIEQTEEEGEDARRRLRQRVQAALRGDAAAGAEV